MYQKGAEIIEKLIILVMILYMTKINKVERLKFENML